MSEVDSMILNLYLRNGQVVTADVEEVTYRKSLSGPGLNQLTWTKVISGPSTDLLMVNIDEIVAMTLTRTDGGEVTSLPVLDALDKS